MPEDSDSRMQSVQGSAQVHDYEKSRIYKALDQITTELKEIRKSLVEVAEVKVNVKAHSETLYRYGQKIDNIEAVHANYRVKETQMKGEIETLSYKLSNLNGNYEELKKGLESNTRDKYIANGQKDISKEILKIAVTILTGYVIFLITKG